jgi:ligand-binding SRPBCC domain-containing protein
MILERTTIINAPLERVFDFFCRPENLALLTPPAVRFEIRERPAGPMEAGSRMAYRIRVAGIPLNWVSRITAWNPGRSFIDAQVSGPFRKWVHTHTFTARGSSVEMGDRVEYELPFGILGRLVAGWFVRRQLQGIFGYREKKIREIFASR